MLPELEKIPEISFIDNMTIEELQSQMILDFQNRYKELTGETCVLEKADEERLILYACSLQLYQAMQYVDIQAKKNLLKYSNGDYLDHLAVLRGLIREKEKRAKTMIRYSLDTGRETTTQIPKGSRVSAGKFYFYTTEYAEITPGNLLVDVPAECSQKGEIGNGFLPGEISQMIDLIPHMKAASNITQSDGGSGAESDEQFAERIFLYASEYSVAGPEDSYISLAKKCNSNIGDIKITSNQPYEVDLYFVMKNGELPTQEVIHTLNEYLSGKTVRPMTDRLVISAPEITPYKIDLDYYINASDKGQAVEIQKKADEQIQAFLNWQDTRIGRDINPSVLARHLMLSGIKRVKIREPQDQVVSVTSIAKCKEIHVVYGGIEDD